MGRARPGANRHGNIANLTRIAIASHRLGTVRRILTHNLTAANEIPQRYGSRTTRPHRTRAIVPANLHRLGTKIHSDRLTRSVSHFQPRAPERRFHDGNHQADTESHDQSARKAANHIAKSPSNQFSRQPAQQNESNASRCTTHCSTRETIDQLQVGNE